VASRIHHANAVSILDVGESPHGYFLVMDYVDGCTLSNVRTTPKLTDEEKTRVGVRVILDALAGLHAAHDLSDDEGRSLHIVHRDVSPHNVLIGSDGLGRITDFGIALASSRIAASRPGMIKGKPQYMAPEQVLAKPVDRRADVFCAGIILWEFLSRGRLFRGDTEAATMMMVCNMAIERPSSRLPLPDGFDDVCMKALERDVDRRYPTARAFADALHRVAEDAHWSLSTGEVAERVNTAFVDDITRRKSLVRDHARATGQGSVATGRTPAVAERPRTKSMIEGDTLAVTPAPSLAAPPKETSASIPAIEVGPQAKPNATTTRLSVPQEAPTSRVRIVAAAAITSTLVAVGAAWWSRSHTATPSASAASRPAPEATPSPVPPVAPRVAEPAPAVAPVVAPPPVAPVVAAPPVVAPPAETPAELNGRHRPRAPRPRADAGAPRSNDPALETNPYLRR
jgi:serine/threonine-protein kinase